MKKHFLLALSILGIASTMTMQTHAVYLTGAQQAGVSVGTEWFFNQQRLPQAKTQLQCSEFWSEERYYLSGDADSDGIPDMGRQWYFKDNFIYEMNGTNRGAALIVPRFGQYIGTTVSYYTPTNASNAINVYHAGNQYPLTSQKAFYRFSKVAPVNQPVRAIESEPFLIEAPQSRLSGDAQIQIVFNISFAPFSSWGNGTSDYFVGVVSSLLDFNPVLNSNRRWMKGGLTNVDGPSWTNDYLNQTNLNTARSINWTTEVDHGAECVNVKTFWCGDGIVNTGSFNNGVTANEQCDLGAQNGITGSNCTRQCQLVPVVQDPDVSIAKSVVGKTTGYEANEIVTYKLLYRNIGTGLANNVQIRDMLPTGLTLVGVVSTPNIGQPVQNGQELVFPLIPTLLPGALGEITIQARISQFTSCSQYINKSFINAINEPNTLTGNNASSAIITTQCAGGGTGGVDLWSNKVVDKAIVTSGEIVTYTIRYGNSGDVASTGIVTDTIPTGMQYMSGSSASIPNIGQPLVVVSATGVQQLIWNIGPMQPNFSGTIIIQTRVVAPIQSQYLNTLCITNDNNRNNNNCGSAISNPPGGTGNNFDLSILKTPTTRLASSGEEFDYTLTVTNSGVAVSGFSVRDYLPIGLQYVSSPQQHTYDPITRVVTWNNLSVVANGTIAVNVRVKYASANTEINWTEICTYTGFNAITSPKDIDSIACNGTGNNEDDISSGSVSPRGGGGGGPTVDVTLNKLVNNVKDYTANNGETVTFTLRATNEGNTTITNVSIVDYLPQNVEYISGSASVPAGAIVSYDTTTRRLVWSGLVFTNNASFDLTFRAVYTATDTRINYAEICAYNGRTVRNGLVSQPTDNDSDPCNRGANTPVEDDESSASIKPRSGGGGGGRNYCGDGVIARPNSYGQIEECDEGSDRTKPNYNGKVGGNCSITCKTMRVVGGGVCGDGKLDIGEVCDQGINGGVIPSGRPFAGQTCLGTTDRSRQCTIVGRSVPVCEYIDPPSIQSNEYLPYWWDVENIANVQNTCQGNPGSILRNSMQCEFVVTNAKLDPIDRYIDNCYDRVPDRLTQSAYNQVMRSLGYAPDNQNILPYGFASRKFNFGNTLGEHKITMTVLSYEQCNADGKGGTRKIDNQSQRLCEMNFAVTKPYMVSRGPLGNFVSDPVGLTEFRYMPEGLQVFTSPVPRITQKFDVTQEVKDSVNKLVSEYKKLAVVAQSLPEFGDVSKVPGKDIYFFEGKTDQSFITISDKNAKSLSNKPFTIIVTRGQLIVKGNLANAGNGMYINASANGSITFAMDDKEGVNGVKGCDVTQQVQGIFISLNGVASLNHEGKTDIIANTDTSKEWCNGGDLTVRGVLIGNDITDNVVARRRSNVNSWFNELTSINADRKEYLLNHGSLVLKYNPELFDNLPPGAEVLTQLLNTYKK